MALAPKTKFRFGRAAFGFALMIIGSLVSLPTVEVGESRTAILDRVREEPGVPIERYPNGSVKSSLVKVIVGDDVYEKRIGYTAAGVPTQKIFKTPTRDFVEVWDTAHGWVPGEVLRDESTLAARWGLPQTEWPYWIASALFMAGGTAFIAASFSHRRQIAKPLPE